VRAAHAEPGHARVVRVDPGQHVLSDDVIVSLLYDRVEEVVSRARTSTNTALGDATYNCNCRYDSPHSQHEVGSHSDAGGEVVLHLLGVLVHEIESVVNQGLMVSFNWRAS
jgi:hypothetical protein